MPEENNINNNINNNKIIPAIIISIIIIVLATALVLIIALETKQTMPDLDKLVKDIKQIEKTEKEQTQESQVIRNGKMSLQIENNLLKIGNEFEVKIYINTENSNIVLASAIIEYDPEDLELIYDNLPADTKNSVLNMSVINKLTNNPALDGTGKIEIIQAAPGDTDYLDNDDGFNGSGELASLKFKALKTGQTKIVFSKICDNEICDESSMILDNGKGTKMQVKFEDLNIIIND